MPTCQSEVYFLNADAIARLNGVVATIAKKANKMGLVPPSFTVGESKIVKIGEANDGQDITELRFAVQVESICVVYNGWRLVGVIEPVATDRGVENRLTAVPGEIIPEGYRRAGIACDHCKTIRRRLELFVIRHENGEYKQVGRNCLSAFLNGYDAEAFVCWLEWMQSIVKECEADEEEYRTGFRPLVFSKIAFLTLAAAVIRVCGFVSRSAAAKANEESYDGRTKTATADVVSWLLSPHCSQNDRKDKEKFIDDCFGKDDEAQKKADADYAAAALAWGKELGEENDYIFNLGVACRMQGDMLRPKEAGIMCSLITAYWRAMNPVVKETTAKPVSSHQGTVGERSSFAGLKVVHTQPTYSDFGTGEMVKFVDANGNIFVWFASNQTDFEKDKVYNIVATVKKHDAYNGTAQTIINRVKEDIPKPAKGRKRAATAS